MKYGRDVHNDKEKQNWPEKKLEKTFIYTIHKLKTT